MSLPFIVPPEDQPLWVLMQELEALGGVRGQDFKAVAGSPRWGYQVTPELLRKWQEAGGVDTSVQDEPADPPPPPIEADSGSDDKPAPAVSEQDASGQDAATEDSGTAAPAQGDKATKATSKRAPRTNSGKE